MDDLLNFLETVVVDHVQRDAFIGGVQTKFVEGDDIFVLDDEVWQQAAFDDDPFPKADFPEDADR